MNRVYGKVLFAMLLVILVVEIIILAPKDIGSSKDMKLNKGPVSIEKRAEQKMRKIHLVESKGDQKEWELWSEVALGFNSGGKWLLEGVRVKFFGDNGESYVVTGREGKIDTKSKDLEISGNVEMNSSNRYYFKTPKISYSSLERVITSPNEVFMRGPKSQEDGRLLVWGKSLSTDLKTGIMRVVGDVRAKKELSNSRTVSIKSQAAKFSSRKNLGEFTGEVVIDYEGSRITGPIVDFGYDSIAKTVSSLLVRGGAKITDMNRWATATQVHMLFDTDKYILRGAPRVVQNNDELRGEEIVFLDRGREIQVRRAKARIERPEDYQSE
jgi:LPS export ABC transporter protein LptC